jgi:hypothetical protein
MQPIPLTCLVLLSINPWLAFESHAMNNDGKSDILWRNYTTGTNEVWLMNGASYSSTAGMSPVADPNWRMVATADFDGDGQLDILWYYSVTGQPLSGHIAYWYMNSTSQVLGLDLISASPSVYQTDPATWDLVGAGYFGGAGDKRPDLLWLNKTTGEMAVWFMNNSSYVNSSYLTNTSGIHVPVPAPWKYATTGDPNNDERRFEGQRCLPAAEHSLADCERSEP